MIDQEFCDRYWRGVRRDKAISPLYNLSEFLEGVRERADKITKSCVELRAMLEAEIQRRKELP